MDDINEMRPTQAIYCKGSCGNMLRLIPISLEPDDGLRSEYKNGYCKQCFDNKTDFYNKIQFENEPITW